MTRFAGRTIHGIPRMALAHAANPTLRIGGLVGRPLNLVPEDFELLPRVPYLGESSCVEGGNLPRVDWAGIRLSDLLMLADPAPEARFVCVKAGPYGVPVALADAARALLCDRLDGERLAVEHGGPWRLVVPGSRYFTSVKWVDSLEVTTEPPDNSAERIARARARAREAHAE